MAYVVLPTKAKDDAFGFQHANNIKTDLDYLKTQSEVLVAEDATAISSAVVPALALKASSAPVERAVPVARAAQTGGLAWEALYQSEDFWAFK